MTVGAALGLQGLVIETVSKVPYLCRGDGRYPFYILYDAILVCKPGPIARSDTVGAGVGVGVGASDLDRDVDFSPLGPTDRKLAYRDDEPTPSKLDFA